MNPWVIAIGAALGLLKSRQEEKQKQKESRLESARARFSPWTGAKARRVGGVNVLGNVMAGASMGAMMGQQNPGMFGGGGGAKPSVSPGSAGGGSSMSPPVSNEVAAQQSLASGGQSYATPEELWFAKYHYGHQPGMSQSPAAPRVYRSY